MAKRDMKELAEAELLCPYCDCTDFGLSRVNTCPYDLCEGRGCETAYSRYYEDNNEEEEE